MAANKPEDASTQSPIGGDYLLESMVRMVDTEGVKIGITLFVRGTIVSGVMVSGDEYLEGCAKRFMRAKGGEKAKQALAGFMANTEHAQPPGTEGGDDVTANTGYVHLQEARVVQAGSRVNEGIWWRGRMDCIDAFHFGVLREPAVRHPQPS